MKTVITAKENQEESTFDLRFGRGAYFCLFDSETMQIEFHKNEFAEAQGGAGTKAAEKMIALGAQKVISGDFGPKAKELLEKFKIQMVIFENDEITIAEIIKLIS
ncbi:MULTISPECIES: NifB/NifX family molybdenum-iron cluster-binding protein [unclassified Lentimicrobium]|uniref:NifB/NifX family molybdenum-iron cluster-binding protein n=1 Tax=unclassified Lentimicrobium TaxID=2677434 RepID=UPI0015558C3A|nr:MULTISPECIES: NifB/NifX family molybdenum-iron cluster-binding protein [unclassified Lentimicrobium]NPD46345.1 dinitrogenase iron-molybdenum cofactor biosynthesis protein [Lentimicrobium sp. S6]NPD85016.1 dinitrogenase iron-molybdenum cofactor biosynthesis protein [Lentimicrobium sp. L6]